MKKKCFFKFYKDYFNNNENTIKNIVLQISEILNNSKLNIKCLSNESKTTEKIKNKETNFNVLPKLESFKRNVEKETSEIINNKEMIFSNTLFQKNIEKSKLNDKK